MRLRVSAAVLLVGLFFTSSLLGATGGGVKGRVLVNLRAAEGIALTLANVNTGKTYSVHSAKDGSFSVSLPNGAYVVLAAGGPGLSIGKAPLLIQVSGDRFASANIELSRIGQDGQEGGTIFHNPVSCVSANQFPVFDATFDPPGSVVSAKLYFKSNLSDEWFYTEFQLLTGNFPKYRWTMVTDPSRPGAKNEGDDIRRRWTNLDEPEPIDPGVPPTHRAFLPKIKEGFGITQVTYYLEVTLSNFTVAKTREIPIRILAKGDACKAGFAAPGGAPQGLLAGAGLTGLPAGLEIGSGLAELLGTAAGLGLVGGLEGSALAEGSPAATPASPASPTATPPSVPTPTTTPPVEPTPTPPTPPPAPPTPTPTPTPTPIPDPGTCQVQVSVSPPGGQFNPCRAVASGGGLGTTIVTSSQTFGVPCDSTLSFSAILGPPASFIGPPVVTWSGTAGCKGTAIGTPCQVSPTLLPASTVVLICGSSTQ